VRIPGLGSDRNGQWFGFDQPVHRDWLFWVVCALDLALVVVGIAMSHHSITGSLLALVGGPLVLGCFGGAARNLARGWRAEMPD
jgi:hypothetical protein